MACLAGLHFVSTAILGLVGGGEKGYNRAKIELKQENTMDNRIDKQMVQRVALLGRLELSEAETAQLSGNLSEIVGYIEKINELDTSQVEPLAHCLPVQNVLRADVPRPSLSNEQALANAPDSVDGYFKVPKILDDNSGA